MKKIIVITFFFVFVICERSFGQFSLNFSAGINHANCKFVNFEGISPKARIGYFFGVAPNYQISKKVQVQIDFQYSLKGYDTGSQNNFTPLEFRYGYLDIIPEIEFYMFEYLAFGVGVNYGIKLNEQFKFRGDDWTKIDGFESISSTDFGLTGKLKTNYKNMFGFVRYNIGVKDISDAVFIDDNGQKIENAKQLNRNLQIGIGYKFNFKKD